MSRLSNNTEDEQTLDWVDEVLERLPRLWEYAWKEDIIKHHKPLYTQQYGEESKDLPNALIHTVSTMNHLHLLRQCVRFMATVHALT
jgi:hypothetical protein